LSSVSSALENQVPISTILRASSQVAISRPISRDAHRPFDLLDRAKAFTFSAPEIVLVATLTIDA
jgi:hypothetical protein